MRKLLVVGMMLLTLLVGSAVAHAERGDIGGVGVTAVCPPANRAMERGDIGTLEHGSIGGVGTLENGAIWPWACRSERGGIVILEHGNIGGVGVH